MIQSYPIGTFNSIFGVKNKETNKEKKKNQQNKIKQEEQCYLLKNE